MPIRKRVTPRKRARKANVARAKAAISMLGASPSPPPGIYAVQYMDGTGGLVRRILTYRNTEDAPIGTWVYFSDHESKTDMNQVANIQGPLPEFPPIAIPDFTVLAK